MHREAGLIIEPEKGPPRQPLPGAQRLHLQRLPLAKGADCCRLYFVKSPGRSSEVELCQCQRW